MTTPEFNPLRRSGNTTRQMQAAPSCAVYVWPNDRLRYPLDLARSLSRQDLQIVSAHKLSSPDNFLSLGARSVVIDHAVELTDARIQALGVLFSRGVKIQHPRGSAAIAYAAFEAAKHGWINNSVVVFNGRRHGKTTAARAYAEAKHGWSNNFGAHPAASIVDSSSLRADFTGAVRVTARDRSKHATFAETVRAVVDDLLASRRAQAATRANPAPPPAPLTEDALLLALAQERLTFDPTYMFAEDHATFARGQNQFNRICALQSALDAMRANKEQK